MTPTKGFHTFHTGTSMRDYMQARFCVGAPDSLSLPLRLLLRQKGISGYGYCTRWYRTAPLSIALLPSLARVLESRLDPRPTRAASFHILPVSQSSPIRVAILASLRLCYWYHQHLRDTGHEIGFVPFEPLQLTTRRLYGTYPVSFS